MAAIVVGQNLAFIVIIFTVIALVKLCIVVISLLKERRKLLKLTKGIDRGGLKEPHFLYGDVHEVSPG